MRNKLLSTTIALSLLIVGCSRSLLPETVSTEVEVNQEADFKSEANRNENEEEEPCLVEQTKSRQFLPQTSQPPLQRIIPATENECAFYNWSLQSYLYATQPEKDNQPAFLSYESFEDVFELDKTSDGSLPVLNAGFRQAGEPEGILVDQNHNPIFYSIYINSIFADFVRKENLNKIASLINTETEGGVSAELEFPPGATEFKAAWKIVEPHESTEGYFTMKARVPLLRNEGDRVVASSEFREVQVALLSLHVVGVVEDHPEFIWATFEHVDEEGKRDIAPAATRNPENGATQTISTHARTYPLFNASTPVHRNNEQPLLQIFDEESQKFSESTSVFRVYPASLLEEVEEDAEVVTLNQDLSQLFEKNDPVGLDYRRFYKMVGAVWIDKPDSKLPNGVFKANQTFQNYGEHKILAGEDGLSSMALESFTQITRPNCFSCHNTLQKKVTKEHILPPRKINVSNVLTFYVQKVLN